MVKLDDYNAQDLLTQLLELYAADLLNEPEVRAVLEQLGFVQQTHLSHALVLDGKVYHVEPDVVAAFHALQNAPQSSGAYPFFLGQHVQHVDHGRCVIIGYHLIGDGDENPWLIQSPDGDEKWVSSHEMVAL